MTAVSEIKQKLAETADKDLPEVISLFEDDERAGVQKLLESARKRFDRLQQEIKRIDALKEYERKYPEYDFICGIDEVGRGPFAGPVVAGAVILPKDCDILYINDSKKLSEKVRDMLYAEISEKAVSCAVGIVDAARIDEINILQATYEAMRQAGSYNKGRCKKYFHRSSKHLCQGHQRPHDA